MIVVSTDVPKCYDFPSRLRVSEGVEVTLRDRSGDVQINETK